jgi:serine/threonine protein phosphatase PrpC
MHAGDRLLLCSDGLTEMVTDEVIATILAAESDPEAACTKLVAQANEAGGRDNITVVIVRFDPADLEPGHARRPGQDPDSASSTRPRMMSLSTYTNVRAPS